MSEPPDDSTGVPGLHDLRAWREVQGTPADPAPVAAPPEAPRPTFRDHARQFVNLRRDDALVLARPEDRRGLLPETIFVLGVSLGASAVWSILRIIERLTRGEPLKNQTTTINNTVTPDRPWLDLAYQLANIVLPLVAVALAFYLLAAVRRSADGPFRVMGISWQNVPRDAALGVILTASIGIPGLGLYFLGRWLGFSVEIVASNLAAFWWTIPVLILLAAMNGILEEIVMIGYLFTRWTQIGWHPWRVIITSAVIRGSYHLYQGFGGFVGNFFMGALFGWVYMRTKRVLPLVIAHTLLDIFSFVGYSLLKGVWSWL